jgi:hypothetical protein
LVGLDILGAQIRDGRQASRLERCLEDGRRDRGELTAAAAIDKQLVADKAWSEAGSTAKRTTMAICENL